MLNEKETDRFKYSGDRAIQGRGAMTDLEYCRFRQTEAGDYIRAAGPDRIGAMRGAEDWILEEALLEALCNQEKST